MRLRFTLLVVALAAHASTALAQAPAPAKAPNANAIIDTKDMTPEQRSAAILAQYGEPVLDPQSAQRTEEAIKRYKAIAAKGGWPLVPAEAKYAVGAEGPDVELLRRRLVVTGDSGRFDDWNAQRRENIFLPQLKGLPNVVVRAAADLIPGARLGWRSELKPPKDGGRRLMADLEKVGWQAPIRFEGLPPHVFAEYRRLAAGGLAVHLINYDPGNPIVGAKVVLPAGARATVEEPFGDDSLPHPVAADGQLPAFSQYALLLIGH